MEKEKYGSFLRRLLAYLFDQLLLFLIPLFLLLIIVYTCSSLKSFWLGLLWLLWEILFLQQFLITIYLILTFLWFGGSLGKYLAGLRIEKEDGQKPKLTDALIRYLVGYFVSGLFFGLGFWWILKDKKRKAFHDHFAKTVVVEKESSWPLIIALPSLIVLLSVLIINLISVGRDRGVWQGAGKDLSIFGDQLSQIILQEENLSPKTLPDNKINSPLEFR